MNTNQHTAFGTPARGLGRRLVRGLAHAARAIGAAAAECHRAQRDVASARLQPDRYALDGDSAPDTYAEFLFRSQGTIWHEPSASARQRAATAGARRR